MKVYIYFLFFFITNVALSQNTIILSNKEYLELQDKVKLLANSKTDSAIVFADRIEGSNNYTHKTFALGIKSYLFQLKGDSIKSKQLYRLAFNNLEKIPSSRDKTSLNAGLLNFGGLANWKRGNFSQALKLYQQGKFLYESFNDWAQVIKLNYNIAIIYAEVDKYELAISLTKESDKFISSNVSLYTTDEYFQNKSNVNMNIGSFYEKYYFKEEKKEYLLDSAFSYYKKTLMYSKDLLYNKIKAQKNIGNIYFFKQKFKEAEKSYLDVLILAKENDFQDEYSSANYNLGFLYFTQKEYNKSLICFQKVDSLSNALKKSNSLDYIYSNYYQAKIYDLYNDNEKAIFHSKIYLKNYYPIQLTINKESLDINYNLGGQDLKKEINDLQKKNKEKVFKKNGLIFILVVLLFLFSFIFFINYKKRKSAEAKITAILAEYESNLNSFGKNKSFNKEEFLVQNDEVKEEKDGLVISSDKEAILMAKLKILEDKQYYLKSGFNQQEIAKKLKTNTTYLSYVVNKNYQKTFSVYYNELRINYVINEIINNVKYRKYTTQAIAESAGFKNADSFTSSFKKKTGVTPYQFIDEIKKRESIHSN